MKRLLWLIPLALAACGGSDTAGQGAGFSGNLGTPYASGGGYGYTAPTQTSAAAPSMRTSDAVQRAMGYSLKRDARPVVVGGRNMELRVVTIGGRTIAVMGEQGIPFTVSAHPDLTAEATAVAVAQTGCRAEARSFRNIYSNGAYPKYAVPLICG